MPERSSKQGPKDANETAFRVFQEATGEADLTENEGRKNPAAVSLGRLGGLKGGKERARRLSPEKRSEIARLAAEKRWGRKDG